MQRRILYSPAVVTVVAVVAPLPNAGSVTDKVYSDAWNVRDQSRMLFERRRKGNPVVASADCDWPAKVTGKRDIYVSVIDT